MALVPLFDEVNQFNDYNGTVLAAGKLYVYHLGRTRLADIYSDLNGTVMQNPVTLDNLGRGPIYVSQDFNYTLVVMDEYGQEMFSQDKFIYSQGGPHNSANVAVGASEYIAVSSTQIGDTTVYTPYLTGTVPGSGGKTYSGIDPIVVNNDEDKISANTVPFGVQEPLYFVEDETATIIGLSGNPSADAVNWVTAQNYLQRPDLIGYATKDFVEEEVSGKYDTSAFATISGAFLTALPEGSMNESAFGYSGGLITSYNGSAFKAGDEFPQSATDAIQVVTSNSGNWDDSYSAVTSKSAVWDTVTGKLDESAFSSVSGDFQTTAGMTAYQPAGDYLTTGDSSNFYTTANESGFITGVDLTPYQTTAGMTAYASKDDVSGLQSASVWNDAVDTVSSNSASWTGIEYTGVSPIVVDNATRSISADTWSVTFGSGLSAIDDTANSATTIVVTAAAASYTGDAQGALDEVYTKSGDWNGVVDTVSSNSASWTGGGDSNIFYVTYGTTTFDEIWSADYSGKTIILKSGGSINGDLPVNQIFRSNNPTASYAYFNYFGRDVPSGGVDSRTVYKVDGANTWTTKTYGAVPTPSTGDTGKILGCTGIYQGYRALVGWIDPPTGATLPVSGSAGENSAVYDLYDMKIERNLPSIGGSEPEHTYVRADTASITLYESYDEDQSYNQIYVSPGYIEFYNNVDGYVDFGGTDVINWESTYETVTANSASWGSTISVATGSI